MHRLRILSSAEQVARYLRTELADQVWTGIMPGGDKLARELGVGANTMEAALKILEKEGWLVNQGRRRGRLIQQKKDTPRSKQIRIKILLGDQSDREKPFLLELLSGLENAGYRASFIDKSQDDFADNTKTIAQFVDQTNADAWVVFAGSREVLEWFAARNEPCFAIAGRASQVPIPSIAPEKITPLRAALRKLADRGHRRISMICRPIRRLPEPGRFERAFLEELESLEIPTGPYNLPAWEENIDDFHTMLDSLFGLTPPTALFIDEAVFAIATLQFCTKRGLECPRDFSLICTDADPVFDWCKPTISHIKWDSGPITRRIVSWAQNVAEGREDSKKGFYPAKFVEGGTIGPAKSQGDPR